MAEAIIGRFVSTLAATLRSLDLDYEILLVDDGSTDETWRMIGAECRQNSRVRGIRLLRNVGQHRAISAGLKYCEGEAVIIMDCDLQDDPNAIGALILAYRTGFDVVFTHRERREYSAGRNVSAAVFYRLLGFRYGTRLDPAVGTFTLVSRHAVARLLSDPLHAVAYLVALRRTGLKSTRVRTTHRRRPEGTSSYGFGRLAATAFSLLFRRPPPLQARGEGVAEKINLPTASGVDP